MADRFSVSHIRSETPGDVPHPDELSVGEVAINIADKKIFTKNVNGDIIELSNGDVLRLLMDSSGTKFKVSLMPDGFTPPMAGGWMQDPSAPANPDHGELNGAGGYWTDDGDGTYTWNGGATPPSIGHIDGGNAGSFSL